MWLCCRVAVLPRRRGVAKACAVCSCCSCACPCRSYCCLRCAVAQQFCRGLPVCSWQAILHRSRSALLYYHICASPQRVTLASTSTSTSVCLLCCWRLSNVCHSAMPGLCNSGCGRYACTTCSTLRLLLGGMLLAMVQRVLGAQLLLGLLKCMLHAFHPCGLGGQVIQTLLSVLCVVLASVSPSCSCVSFPRPFWTAEACLLGTCNPSLQRRAGVMCLQRTCQHQPRLCCFC